MQLGGASVQGYYGAWQGRHSLWLQDGSAVPDGTQVTRADQGGSATTYLTASYPGTLTRRTQVAGDINDLLNLPVNIWANFQYQLLWDGLQWLANGTRFTDFASLAAQPQMFVSIMRFDSQTHQTFNYVYDPQGASGAGFYLGQPNPQGGGMVSTGTPYLPTSQDRLNINIGGNIYIQYDGTGWVKKTVVSVDPQTNTPTFAANGDTAYTLTPGYPYYVNTQGCNEIVTCTAPGVYDVQKEIQTAANPGNLTAVLGTAASFRGQVFNGGAQGQTSTYTFVQDPASADYLKLVYATVGTLDAAASPAPSPGSPVTTALSSLEAYDAGNTDLGIQYNWDYPSNGNSFGSQTFLYTQGSDLARTYKLLDNPIPLAPLNVTTLGGGARTLSLQFDGWMQGLPQLSDELARNDWTMTDEVAAKIINLPAATLVSDGLDASRSYLIKPLQVGVYLKQAAVPDPTLDLTTASAIDLPDPAVLPPYSDNGLGAEPVVATVKYSSGVLLP